MHGNHETNLQSQCLFTVNNIYSHMYYPSVLIWNPLHALISNDYCIKADAVHMTGTSEWKELGC